MKDILNFFQEKANGITDGLIATRESREPCFGIQTVFAPLVDGLARRRQGKIVSRSGQSEEVIQGIRK
jgi:hypothetical protein